MQLSVPKDYLILNSNPNWVSRNFTRCLESLCLARKDNGFNRKVERQLLDSPFFSFFAASLTAILIGTLGMPIHGDEQILFDFESPQSTQEWKTVAQINIDIRAVPPFRKAASVPPRGQGITISTEGKSGLYTQPGSIPRDWSNFQELRLWVHRPKKEVEKRARTNLEIRLYETDSLASYWQQIELEHIGWKKISLSLNQFRWGKGRVPSWKEVSRFSFWFPANSSLSIDSIAVSTTPHPNAAYLSMHDLRAIAFPDTEDTDIQLTSTERVALISDTRELECQRLAQHLTTVAEAVSNDFPFLEPSTRLPRLLIFANQQSYRNFSPRLAATLHAKALPPASDGFTIRGIATSFWDKSQGTLRPVYTHEYIHALLTESFRLPPRGDWFHEGLATYYQLKYHPQENLSKMVLEGLANSEFRLPLADLCNGERIPQNRYWQAMTVVKMLLRDPQFSDRLPLLCQQFRRTGSTDLTKHLTTLLETNWLQFEHHWRAYCETQYGEHLAP